MTLNEVKKYLKTNELFLGAKVRYLSKGNNYLVFIIQDKSGDYIFKTPRKDVKSNEKLWKEYHILEYLNSEKITFVQKPILYDELKKISILTFVPGRLRSVSSLNTAERKVFVRQIFKIHSLKYTDYKKYCKRRRVKPMEIETSADRIKEYGLKRFRLVEKHNIDKELCDWIKPRLKKFSNAFSDTGTTIFNHRDLAGSNIVTNKNGMFFIDWDMAVFMKAHDYWLAYMLVHDDGFTNKKFTELVRAYSWRSKLSIETLSKRINEQKKLIQLLGVVWAAEQFTTLTVNKKKNAKKFLNIAHERIQEFELAD